MLLKLLVITFKNTIGMIKKTLLAIALLCYFSSFAFTQTRSSIDTLLQIKDYLLEVKNLASNSTINGKERYGKVSALLKSAIAKEAQFKEHLKSVTNENNSDYKELTGKLHWILQSIALYKADIVSSGYKRPPNSSEEQYLNQNIPPLVNQLNHYCKWAKQQIDYKTH